MRTRGRGYGMIYEFKLPDIGEGLHEAEIIRWLIREGDEMIESAKIDGAGFVRIFRYIMLPLSITGFVVVAIWQFTNIWNEFLFAVTITTSDKQPIMVALQNLSGSQIVQWNVQMAGVLLAALPTLLVYIFHGKYFVRGLLAGSVKG